jgi:dTDP-4-amino-4,6-dideoxygalactose transaminase
MTKPDITRLGTKVAAALPAFPEEDLPEILHSIEEILRSGWLILGKYTHDFEESFRQYVGTEYAVAVNSCTTALQITLRFMGAKDREVIMPVNNFPGVVTAALSEGVRPVLAEMDTQSFCMDVNDAIERVTPKTAGMIVVHIAGRIPPGMERLRKFCSQRGLFLIEDASHAHGAEIDGRKAGNLADAACFSFYPTKIMTTGTGGMITTDNSELARFAQSVRHHGQGSDKALFIRQGNDWCMNEIQAVLGLQQLRRLDENVEHRNRIVNRYREGLERETWLTIPSCPDSVRHAYYKLPVLLDKNLDTQRFRRILGEEFLVENGTIYDPPCHLQPVFSEFFSLQKGSFPSAESALTRQFCPPVHSTLPLAEVDRVIGAMKSVAARISET